MTRNLITIDPHAPIAEAANLMARRRVRRLLVVESYQDRLCLTGIVSASDILHAFPPGINPFAVIVPDTPDQRLAVKEIMNCDPLTVTPEAPIEEAALLMRDRKIGALPVVRDGNLVGIITESDIFRTFTTIFSSSQSGLRITFAIERLEDAFRLIIDLTVGHAVHVLSLFTSVQGDIPVCVVRFAGVGVEAMLEAIWESEHRVLNVLHFM